MTPIQLIRVPEYTYTWVLDTTEPAFHSVYPTEEDLRRTTMTRKAIHLKQYTHSSVKSPHTFLGMLRAPMVGFNTHGGMLDAPEVLRVYYWGDLGLAAMVAAEELEQEGSDSV